LAIERSIDAPPDDMNQSLQTMRRLCALGLLGGSILASATADVPTGYLDITAFGTPPADPAGQVDSTAAIQAAIEHAVANRLALWFPPGTYRISDRLEIDQPDNQAGAPAVLMGSTASPLARATLYLAPYSPGFGQPAARKAMVHFYNLGTPEAESGNTDLYDQAVIGLDFKVGPGNDGAVALRMQGAEGCTIQDVNIDLTEGGHTGIWGIPGSGGSTHRVRIEGGAIGIDTQSISGGRGGSQPQPLVSGSTFLGQTQWAVRATTRGALVMVGCRFSRATPGAFLHLTHHWDGQPFDGSLHLTDCSLEYATADADNTVIAMGSPLGRSFHFDNVFVRRATHAWTAEAPANPSGWHHFRRLAVEVPFAARPWGQGREPVYLDGVMADGIHLDGVAGIGPPPDLQSRHRWADGFPTWETPGVVDVTSLGAVGDGTTDNWAVLQQAIDDHEMLFFPKGTFAVSRSLALRPSTALVGVYPTLSAITALSTLASRFNGVQDGEPDAPILRTADTAAASTRLAFIHVRRRFPLAQHNPTPPGNYAIEWRCGGDSVVRHVKVESTPQDNVRPDLIAKAYYGYNTDDPDGANYTPINANHPQADFLPGHHAWPCADPIVQVRGNGGGRWFNFWVHGRQALRQETPVLRVAGTRQPLRFYHLHLQQQDSRHHAEFIGAANVSVYGTKGELKGAFAYFSGCRNVRVFGSGGMSSPDPDHFAPYLFRFVDCDDFLIAGINDTIREDSSTWIGGIYDRWIHAQLLLWSPIQDRHTERAEVAVPSRHRPIAYVRGAPSHHAWPHHVVAQCPWHPSPGH